MTTYQHANMLYCSHVDPPHTRQRVKAPRRKPWAYQLDQAGSAPDGLPARAFGDNWRSLAETLAGL